MTFMAKVIQPQALKFSESNSKRLGTAEDAEIAEKVSELKTSVISASSAVQCFHLRERAGDQCH